MRTITIGIVIVFLLVMLFYMYYMVAGNWRQVELSILDTLIGILVTFVANVAAVVIGLDILFPEKINI